MNSKQLDLVLRGQRKTEVCREKVFHFLMIEIYSGERAESHPQASRTYYCKILPQIRHFLVGFTDSQQSPLVMDPPWDESMN